MLQLELVWKLESHNNLLEEHKKNLEVIENNLELRNLEQKQKRTDERISFLKTSLDSNNIKLLDNESILRNQLYNFKELENELYKGKITDIKQLERLNKEKDKISELIDNIENNTISLMEKTDGILVEISKLEDYYKKIKKKIIENNKDIYSNSSELIIKIREEEKEIEQYSNKIELGILNRYNTLRKNRNRGIVPVINDICTGCNMIVPSFLFEKLRTKVEIIYCESCGRILYYQPEEDKI